MDTEPIQVACPQCEAERGQPCRNGYGRTIKLLHRQRWKKAKEIEGVALPTEESNRRELADFMEAVLAGIVHRIDWSRLMDIKFTDSSMQEALGDFVRVVVVLADCDMSKLTVAERSHLQGVIQGLRASP